MSGSKLYVPGRGIEQLVVPDGPIGIAQEFQWEIDASNPSDALRVARRALDLIGDSQEIYGGRHLFVHTLGAMVLNRGRSAAELFTWQFNELSLRGHVGGISYVQGPEESGFRSLVLDMFDVHILRPEEGDIVAPLTIPVTNIQSVLAAA